jgi:predicted DNA-binding transcriptional regulator AlpA
VSEQEKDNIVALVAALVAGDPWLSADACAAFLGGIKRRTFLEKIACRPDFPAPAKVLGTTKLWRKSEVNAWTERQKVNRAA